MIQGSGNRVFRYLRLLGLTVVALLAVLGTTADANAQTEAPATQSANLPDAPTPQVPAQQTEQGRKAQLKQTIEVLGKRSIFFPELAHERRPLTSTQKLQARDSLHDYGQGWEGYGKRFGSSVASNASSHLFGTALIPSITHEDPRYFVKLFGSPKSRILYAMSRIVVTRTDDGRPTFNWSYVMGGLMAESLATSYLPENERTAAKTFTRFGVRVGFGALDNVVKEYWPNIFKSLRINKLVPPERSDPGTVTPQVGPPAPPPAREPQH